MRRWLPLLAYAVALAGLLAFVSMTLDRGPFQRSATGNEQGYWQAAAQVKSGEVDEASAGRFPSPLYVRLLAPLTGDGPTAVQDARRAQTLLLLPLFSLAVLALAWRRAGPWPGALAGAAAVLAGPVALRAGDFMPAVPAAVVGLLALLVLDGRPGAVAWIVGGLLAGLLFRIEVTLAWSLAGLLVVAALVRPGRPPRWLAAGLFLVAAAGASLGSGALLGGPRVPTIRGMDVYRGNGTEATGLSPLRTAQGNIRWWNLPDFVREASRETERRMTVGEADRYWAGQGLKEAVTHPGGTLERVGVKLIGVFQGQPLAHEVGTAYLLDRTDSPGLPIAVWVGRILIPLGLAGLVLARKRMGAAVWAGALSGLVAALLTYAEPETRLVTVGCLLVAGAVLVSELPRRGAGFRTAAAAAGAAAILIWGVGGPSLLPGSGITGEDHFQLGAVYDREKRGSAALREYERALRLEPGNPMPSFAIAGMLVRDNVPEEAIRELEALRADHPDFYRGLTALVRLYQDQQRYPEAAAVYGDLIRLDPVNPEPWNNLGTVYATIGYFEQAGHAFRQALALAPDYQAARDNLQALQQRGLAGGPGGVAGPVETVPQAQEAILARIRIGDFAGGDSLLAGFREKFGERRAGLGYIEAMLRLTSGDPARAVPVFEAYADSFSSNVPYLNNWAAACAQAGRLCEAIGLWEKAQALQRSNLRIQNSLAGARAQADSLGLDCGGKDGASGGK